MAVEQTVWPGASVSWSVKRSGKMGSMQTEKDPPRPDAGTMAGPAEWSSSAPAFLSLTCPSLAIMEVGCLAHCACDTDTIFFLDRVLLFGSGKPGTHYVDMAVLEVSEIRLPLSQSAGTEGTCHHTQPHKHLLAQHLLKCSK